MRKIFGIVGLFLLVLLGTKMVFLGADFGGLIFISLFALAIVLVGVFGYILMIFTFDLPIDQSKVTPPEALMREFMARLELLPNEFVGEIAKATAAVIEKRNKQ